MTIELKGGFTTEDPRLDRVQQFDERSRDHPIGEVVPYNVESKVWRLNRSRYGDQGQEGACVEFGWTHVFGAQGASYTPTVSLATLRKIRAGHLFYWPGQRRDYWPGGSYEGADPFYEGTSVLAVAQVAQELGFMSEYRWAFSLDEGVRGVCNEGPAAIALNWDNGLARPRPNGLAVPDGNDIGGHCVAWIGCLFGHKLAGEPKRDLAVIPQSWGLNHGDRGRIYVPLEDLGRKLSERGEQCFPIGRKAVKL